MFSFINSTSIVQQVKFASSSTPTCTNVQKPEWIVLLIERPPEFQSVSQPTSMVISLTFSVL